MIVFVCGAGSRSGKTAAAVALLPALPGDSAVAVKFTATEDASVRCPRGTPCVVCDIDVPFRLIEDPAVLREPGTGTDRLAAAGRAAWSGPSRRRAPLPKPGKPCARLDGGPAVSERSTVAGLARPDLQVLVAHPFRLPVRWQPTTPGPVGSWDLVNCPAGERRQVSPRVLAALARYRRGREVRAADVARPLADWAPELLACLS